MRYLLTIILAVFLATPAFAETFCPMSGPHNCKEQIDDQLTAITKNTVVKVQMSQDQHPFKTQNDEILAAAGKKHQILHLRPTTGLAFWRK